MRTEEGHNGIYDRTSYFHRELLGSNYCIEQIFYSVELQFIEKEKEGMVKWRW